MENATENQEILFTCLEIGKLLTSTLNPDEILEYIMEKGNQLIQAENWSLLLIDEVTGKLVFEVVAGGKKELLKGVELPLETGVASWVVQTGKPEYIPDVSKEKRFNDRFDRLTGFKTCSIICYPLKIRGKTIGALEILNIHDLSTFNQAEIPGLEILADYAAIAIENSRYVKKIELMSITDEYTGLYNSRYMHSFLDCFFQESQGKRTISVAFADLDDFKKIVDTHGHLTGSRVLKEVGTVMERALPENCLLIKYGGDEYVILMPDADRACAIAIVERVSDAIAKNTYFYNGTDGVRLTASFGVATCPDEEVTKRDLLIAADTALFDKKKIKKGAA